MIEKWEIWNVRYAYDDNPNETKIRPVLVIDVLGEIGGLMEIIFSFFGVICNFIGDIL